jgi:non-ribosomal peptide synthetase component F
VAFTRYEREGVAGSWTAVSTSWLTRASNQARKGIAAMTVAHDEEAKRYPLSFTQEWFLTMDKGDDSGAFGGRYLLVSALRITGPVDLAVLQGALDDVVARHELLRTLVVRDAHPPYQMVLPPCQVPLEVRDLPPATGTSRDMVIQELMLEAHAGTISAREVPLLRALLGRFDDRDSALFLTVHHSVSDGWSVQVILRDLGAFYAGRVGGAAPKLEQMRQYREYVQWQRASAASTDDDGALKYWAEKLDGAREFAIPNDHGQPESYSRPFSLHVFSIDADTMAAAAVLANAARGTLFMVLLSAIYVLANRITGATDLTVNAVTSGRNELQFHNTMGLFLNVLPFRTEIAGCASFRDVVLRTRATFIDAMAHELPAGLLEQAFPDYIRSREDTRRSQFLISQPPSQYGEMTLPIAEGAKEISEVLLEEAESADIPGGGTVWYLNTQPDGTLSGAVHFNRDEFEESTVQGWTAGLKRILAAAVRDPDHDWQQL